MENKTEKIADEEKSDGELIAELRANRSIIDTHGLFMLAERLEQRNAQIDRLCTARMKDTNTLVRCAAYLRRFQEFPYGAPPIIAEPSFKRLLSELENPDDREPGDISQENQGT